MQAAARQQMVARTLAARGIKSSSVLEAMNKVPREAFLPPELRDLAYEDSPLPIGGGQTISQPYIVALMMEAMELDANSTVLDIGTGSGYAAAVFAQVAKEVHSVERVPELARGARETFKRLDPEYANVHVYEGDGTLDLWQGGRKFDAIAVAAASPSIPQNLVQLLKDGGRIVIPVQSDKFEEGGQELVLGVKQGTGEGEALKLRTICDVRFVPLIGKQGF